MTITAKKLENYEKDKDNFIIMKTEDGHNVTNLRTHKLYKVSDGNGHTKCDCPDWLYRGKDNGEACKHLIAVRKLQEQKIQKLINRW